MGCFLGLLSVYYKTRQRRLCKLSSRKAASCKNPGTETPRDLRVRGAVQTEPDQIFELEIHRFWGTKSIA